MGFSEAILRDDLSEERDKALLKEAFHRVEKHTHGTLNHGRMNTTRTWHGRSAESLSRQRISMARSLDGRCARSPSGYDDGMRW